MKYDDLTIAERDRLRAAYDSGFSAGSGSQSLVPDELIELIDAVADDWFLSLETMQAAHRARWPMPGPEVVPGWLLKLASQGKP